MAIFRGSLFYLMKLKKSCGCRGESFTQQNWEGFLFFELVQANKYGKDRAIVKHNGAITSLSVLVADELGLKKYGLIRTGTRSVTDIEIYEKPF